MQIKVTKERERYQSSTQSYLNEYSAIPLVIIKDSVGIFDILFNQYNQLINYLTIMLLKHKIN